MKKIPTIFFQVSCSNGRDIAGDRRTGARRAPLICHAVDIGTAESLPWTSSGWNLTAQETYDISHLVADTLTLLGPSTPGASADGNYAAGNALCTATNGDRERTAAAIGGADSGKPEGLR